MKDTSEKTYSLDALCTLVEMPKRTVRYYIQESMLDRPVGSGRSACYTGRHLEQLLTIKHWQRAGLSLERIRSIQQGLQNDLPPAPPRAGSVEVWSHLIIEDGVELHIDPDKSALAPEQLRSLLQHVRSILAAMRDNKG